MIAFLVLLCISGIAFAHEELQCEFANENLKLSQNDRKFVWSDKTVKPLVIKDTKEMEQILLNLNTARQQLYRQNIYNDFDSFVNDYTEARKDPAPFTLDRMEEFIQEYVPPLATTQDNLGLLVKLFRILEGQMPQLRAHTFIALKGDGVRPAALERINKGLSLNITANGFQFNSLVGLIKISFQGALGYAVINVDYPEKSVPIIMETDPSPPDEKNLQAFKSYVDSNMYSNSGIPVIYSLVGQNKQFIQNNRIVMNDAGFYQKTITHLIYTKPLCSVVQVQNRMNMQTTVVRSLLKYAPTFQLKAYVLARVPQGSGGTAAQQPMFTVGIAFGVMTDEEFYEEFDDEEEENEEEGNEAEVGNRITGKSVEFNSLYELSEDSWALLDEAGKILKVDLREKIATIARVIQLNFGRSG